MFKIRIEHLRKLYQIILGQFNFLFYEYLIRPKTQDRRGGAGKEGEGGGVGGGGGGRGDLK